MRRIGDYSQADFQAMQMADQMQALAVSFIKEAYFAEEELNLSNITETRFVKALDGARTGSSVEKYEFNRMLGDLLIQAVQRGQQQGQPPQQGGMQ